MTYVALGLAVTTVLINWWAGVFHPTNAAAVCRASHLRANSDVLWYGYWRWPLVPDRWEAGPSASTGSMSQPYPYGAQQSVPLYPPQPGQQAYLQPYPPQQRAPYYPPNPGAPQYPQQQGAPQYPPHISSCWRPAALSAQRGPAATLPAAVSTAAGSATASSALSATAATRRRAGREQPIRRASSHWLRRATLFLCRPSRIR